MMLFRIDGNKLAISGAASCFACETGYAAVYSRPEKGSTSWELQGNPIPAKSSQWTRHLLIDSYQMHGHYISLSGNSEGVAVGSLQGSILPSGLINDARLVTQVYRWNATAQDWSSMGQEITREHYVGASPRLLWPPRSIVLSDDGMVLAIGSSFSVDVFSWDADSSSWIPREVDLHVTESMGLVG